MSENKDYQEKNAKMEVGHPSGFSPSDNGQFEEELEGSEKAFRMKPNYGDRGPAKNLPGEEPHVGPGGDSRPDQPGNAGFVTAEEHPAYDRQVPEVQKEDPEVLESQRVDQDDEIIGRYDPVTDGQKNELRPRVTKKGAESEGL